MNDWLTPFYTFITGQALLLSVLGIWFTAFIPGMDRWSKRFFLSYFTALLLCCITILAELSCYYYTVPGPVIYFLVLLESALLAVPLPLQTAYLLHCCKEGIRSSRLFHAVLGLCAVYLALLAGVPFVDGFIYITPDMQYLRGPLYPLILTPVIAVLMLNFAHTLRRRDRLSRKSFFSFIVAQVPLLATLIINLFVDSIPLFDLGYVLSALAMYSFVLSDQIEKDRRHQQEIAHERASVMVLRMRPHFIYNTLMSIYSLCRLDPAKARQVTLDFTNYLRRNFNAVASDSPILFSTELEHTRAYLAVEQAQYNDMLIVSYDTPFTGFRLPPLTLQPIVENAVKHGMDLDAASLHISIRTRRTASGAEVTVLDSGCGFDTSDEESSPQSTLTNIRQRLEMMCGGSLTISPGEDGGTEVKLSIPDILEE